MKFICKIYHPQQNIILLNKEYKNLKDLSTELGLTYNQVADISSNKKNVKKLMDEMDKNKTIKKAAIILPWYFVENYAGRVTSGAKWWPSLRKRMTPYNYKRFHLGNQPFRRPDGKEIMVRVYAIYLSR